MCFGGGGVQTADTGAAEAAKSQAAQAEASARREEARWQQEQARIKQEKEDQAAKEAKDNAERQRLLTEAQNKERAQLSAQGQTGGGADLSAIQSKRAASVAQQEKAAQDMKMKQAEQARNASGGNYLGQSNTLVNQSGFNTAAVGGNRLYKQ